MADDIITSPLAPPSTADRVNGVGQRHMSMNQHASAKRLPGKEEGESSEEGERSSERFGKEQQQQEDRWESRVTDSDLDAKDGKDAKEAPGRLIDVVA